MLIRRFAMLFIACAFSACRIGEPNQMTLTFSAHTQRPVVVTQMSVNGTPLAFTPLVVRGKAEKSRPSSGSGRRLLGYPYGEKGMMVLNMTWVELPAGTAYSASAVVPHRELQSGASDGIAYMPVFVPGGEVLITSDPVPKTANDKTIHDVVRVCATPAPDSDKDFTLQPGEIPALREALAAALTTPVPQTCVPDA